MNYKDTLFFIGKCLTINHESHNKSIIENSFKNNEVDWDAVVKVSTAHYVFPALYLNLKRADFLGHLPQDLIVYMEHITSLNRERNEQIISEAKEIQRLLIQHTIQPVFLKGIGNLLEGLYKDIAERMVGDIDFLVPIKDYEKSIQLLRKINYSNKNPSLLENLDHRHYPRLTSPNKIAAVEVHKELTKSPFRDEFNYTSIFPRIQKIEVVHVLGFGDQLCLSIIATQIHDKGQLFKNIALRNAYDVFLLSKKCGSKQAISKFEKLFDPLNNFLAISNEVFNNVKTLEYETTKESKAYFKAFLMYLDNDTLRRKHLKSTKKRVKRNIRFNVLKKAIISKEHRKWFFKRIADKEWQEARMIEFGLKKPKPNA